MIIYALRCSLNMYIVCIHSFPFSPFEFICTWYTDTTVDFALDVTLAGLNLVICKIEIVGNSVA